MCSAKYFRTHPEPHVLPIDADPQTGQIVAVSEYETSSDWCPVLQISASGAKLNAGGNQTGQADTEKTPNPKEELLVLLNQVIDDELNRWEASFEGLGVWERQFIETERAIFGAKLFIWGKLYGFVTANGTESLTIEATTSQPHWICPGSYESHWKLSKPAIPRSDESSTDSERIPKRESLVRTEPIYRLNSWLRWF